MRLEPLAPHGLILRMNQESSCKVCQRRISKPRPGQKYCNASCRSAGWRKEKVEAPRTQILALLNEQRAQKGVPPLQGDGGLDASAYQIALLHGRFRRRYVLEGSGTELKVLNIPRIDEPEFTHCGVAVLQNEGQYEVTLVFAEAEPAPMPLLAAKGTKDAIP